MSEQKNISLRQALLLADKDERFQQGFYSYFYFIDKDGNPYCNKNYSNRKDLKLCACALGGSVLAVKDLDRRLMFNGYKEYSHKEIHNAFPELSDLISYQKMNEALRTFEINLLYDKIINDKLTKTKEYYNCYEGDGCHTLFQIVTNLNDSFKWSFIEISDFLGVLGYN